MTDAEAAALAAELWPLLHPDRPLAADDWPCYREPECGLLMASSYPRFARPPYDVGASEFPWPVVARFPDRDPFETEGLSRHEDEIRFFNLEPIDDYARDPAAMLALIDALKERRLYLLRLCNGVSNWAAWIGPSAIASSAQAVADTTPEAVAKAALAALRAAEPARTEGEA